MVKPTTSRDPLIGQLVGGRYEVLRVIGKGGTGSIYEVRNIRLGHSFALKTLAGEAATNAEAIQRFRREADIVARIKHPNIVEVIDWDELPDGSPCIVMEYLRGSDLAARIAEAAPLPWPQIAVIADQVLAALTRTHANGVVHRDLKPQNVFLAADDSGDERVKLLDFGVSKIRDSTSLQTMNDRLVGTPAYMAPEQAEGRSEDIGPHTDIWAMAVILHEMATRTRAFDGPSLPSILYTVCHGDPVPIHMYRPDAPPAFVKLIADALTRPIGQRLADAAVMRARLRDALAGVAAVDYSKMPVLRARTPAPIARMKDEALADTVDTKPAGTAVTTPGAGPAKRKRSRAGIVALAGVVLAAAAATAVVLANRKDDASPAQPVTPAVAVVVDERATTAAIADAAVVEPAPDPVIAVPDAGVTTTRPTQVRKPSQATPGATPTFVDQVGVAIGRKMSSLGRCLDQHPSDNTNEINATIEIAPDGRAKAVTLDPAAVASSPLGTCLRDGLLTVTYPVSDNGGKVRFPLRMRAR
jgi:eukaryotic-like serine/threonine-protein kinase